MDKVDFVPTLFVNPKYPLHMKLRYQRIKMCTVKVRKGDMHFCSCDKTWIKIVEVKFTLC